MIIFLLFLIAATAILQAKLGKPALAHLHPSIRSEAYLVEPDTPFTIVLSVENQSKWPVLFLSCTCSIPADAVLCSSSRGTVTTCAKNSQYTFRCFLMPHQRLEHRFQLSLPRRGQYTFTNLRLSVGDFLGLKEWWSNYSGICETVVMPRPLGTGLVPEVAGGLMGEHSVRRWLHEDPILSAGFREYTGREPQKSISWSRSLQSGKLMVRQMDHTAEERISILFALNDGTAEQLEACFSLCRTICQQLETQKLPYSFLHNGILTTAVGMLPPVEAGLGSGHIDRILEGLGRALPEATTPMSLLVRRALLRSQDACCYLLLVPCITPQTRQLAAFLESRSGASVHLISGEAYL